HQFISEWFIKLGVPENIAIEDACKMEHILSKESYDAMKNFVKQHI
ncbi:MAG: metal-dependent transcriptional regulator, partial [Lachnospiraceae bacterium]|nr:metal-dependent transcriptional regulator [Lachnospiraceae bacterium]